MAEIGTELGYLSAYVKRLDVLVEDVAADVAALQISDSSKLPLTGGSIDGNLAVSSGFYPHEVYVANGSKIQFGFDGTAMTSYIRNDGLYPGNMVYYANGTAHVFYTSAGPSLALNGSQLVFDTNLGIAMNTPYLHNLRTSRVQNVTGSGTVDVTPASYPSSEVILMLRISMSGSPLMRIGNSYAPGTIVNMVNVGGTTVNISRLGTGFNFYTLSGASTTAYSIAPAGRLMWQWASSSELHLLNSS